MSRYLSADILDDVVSSYDQTKTTVQGRCAVKTVDGQSALGPPLNEFIDLFTDTAQSPAPNGIFYSDNNRLFVLGAESGGIVPVMLYTLNATTGATAYVGRININLPDTAATTTTFRSIKALDSGTTGWKIFISTTGSVAINGGTFLINKVDLADFVTVGFPTLPFATGNDQKACYFLQDPSNIGAGQLQTATAGSVLDISGDKIYVHNGVAATHQYYVYDTSIAPTYATSSVTGTEATNTINHAGHSYVAGDPVVFTSLTGGAGLTAGVVYFVRAPVAGVSYELSVTTGGAQINFTTDISSASIGRAFGTTGSNFVHKTGNLPALTGTLLLTDSETYAMPGHSANSGFACAFLSTSSNLYLGKLSELTSGATTWPSLITVNMLGSSNEIISPIATYASWSNTLDRAIYSTGQVFVMKQFVNNVIDVIFGGTNNKYFEGLTTEVVEFQPNSSITGMTNRNGWIFIINGSTGQRGVFACDLRSDCLFDHSYFVTKVLSSPDAVYRFITTIDQLYDFTGSLIVYYRTSGFGSISGGWSEIPFADELNTFATGTQVQFKVCYATLGLDTCIPAQLKEFYLGYDRLTDNSENWELSVDDSDNGNPSRTAFRLKTAYSSSVPTLYYRAYDLSNSLIVNHNTSANAARFEYSTDGGVNWSSLGTIPNTVGTLVRYTFSTSPGVDIRPSIRES